MPFEKFKIESQEVSPQGEKEIGEAPRETEKIPIQESLSSKPFSSEVKTESPELKSFPEDIQKKLEKEKFFQESLKEEVSVMENMEGKGILSGLRKKAGKMCLALSFLCFLSLFGKPEKGYTQESFSRSAAVILEKKDINEFPPDKRAIFLNYSKRALLLRNFYRPVKKENPFKRFFKALTGDTESKPVLLYPAKKATFYKPVRKEGRIVGWRKGKTVIVPGYCILGYSTYTREWGWADAYESAIEEGKKLPDGRIVTVGVKPKGDWIDQEEAEIRLDGRTRKVSYYEISNVPVDKSDGYWVIENWLGEKLGEAELIKRKIEVGDIEKFRDSQFRYNPRWRKKWVKFHGRNIQIERRFKRFRR